MICFLPVDKLENIPLRQHTIFNVTRHASGLSQMM